ncbi:hypothetical protein JCM3765_001392 [Sporobolomyces pararoseus]
MPTRKFNRSPTTAYEQSQMVEEYSPATLALREACTNTKSPRLSASRSPTLRQTKSAFQLSSSSSSSSLSTSPRNSSSSSSSGFFGWTRWYRGLDSEKVVDQDAKEPAEVQEVVVSDEVTNLIKEALRKRKELLGLDEEEEGRRLSTTEGQYDEFEWPEHFPISGGGGTEINESNRTSVSSSSWNRTSLPSLDLDDFSSSFDYSPPRSRSALADSSTTSNLRSTQSNVTLKAPQLLRRVSSSSSILNTSVELPPQNPYSPSASPTLSCDDFTLSPTLLSFSTSSLSSESTSRSSSTITSTTSAFSSVSSSTSASAHSDSSFRSKFSSLRKAASSAALNFFNPKEREDQPPPVPPLHSATASVLLRDVLLKHDQSTPDSPSPPLPSHPFYQPRTPVKQPFDHSIDSDSYDLDSPSSAFPPFDPFTNFDSSSPTKSTSFPPTPLSPQPRVLAKQRSFIDPKTRSLRTAPSLLCTPPTPDKTDNKDGIHSAETGEEGSSGGDEDSDEMGFGTRSKGRSRRKRGKRKSRSARNLRNQEQEI